MDEIWKPVVGYEWLYEVSSIGRVKSFWFWIESIIKINCSNWYNHVSLCLNKNIKIYKIHRMVAMAFIQNPENKHYINHINWIKTDNQVKNLEWCTQSENIQHAYNTWLKKVTENHHFYTNHPSKWKFWKNNQKAKKVNQYSLYWEFIMTWGSMIDIQRELLISSSSISQCCNWKRKSAGWFIWKNGF